ncbi:MAG: DUF742 domain-containing protein [Streptosporangiaceae bacterium]
MVPADGEWLDDEAGPLVRPYALTQGRTRPAQEAFDLITLIVTAGASPAETAGFGPEHVAILDLCRRPLSVAEVAARLNLPLAVVRVLAGDLLEQGLIVVRQPSPVSQLPDERVLKEVINGLEAL